MVQSTFRRFRRSSALDSQNLERCSFYLPFPDVPGTRIFPRRGTGEGTGREVCLLWGGRGNSKTGMTW